MLLAAPGDFLPEIFMSGSGVLLSLPRFGLFLAFSSFVLVRVRILPSSS